MRVDNQELRARKEYEAQEKKDMKTGRKEERAPSELYFGVGR